MRDCLRRRPRTPQMLHAAARAREFLACVAIGVAAVTPALPATIAPAPLAAQQPGVPEGVPDAASQMPQLRERLDVLNARLAELEIQDSLYWRAVIDSARRANAETLDTVRIGRMTVIGRPHAVRRTRGAFERGWQEMAPLLDGLEQAVDSALFYVVYDGDLTNAIIADRTRPGRHVVTFIPSPVRGMWTEAVRGALGGVIATRLPQSVRTWMGWGRLGLEPDLQTAYRALVLPPDTMPFDDRGQRCVAGDLPVCKALLDLDHPPGEELDPLNPLRTSFLAYVLTRAPSGTVAASSTDSADLAAVLERMGRAPIDTLVHDWVEHVEDGRPRGLAGFGAGALLTIVWVGIFAALALRSTRWRIG